MVAALIAGLRFGCWRSALLLSLMLAPLMSGCVAPTYRAMVSETQISPHAEAAQRFYAARNDTLLAPTFASDEDDGRPLRVAVHRMGPSYLQAGDRVVVFLHGVLSDSRAWRHVAGMLLDSHRLWLVDYPGVGASDRAHPASLGEGAYSPRWLAERAAQTLDFAIAEATKQQGSAPASITLVGHSLGGAVALHMLSDPHIQSEHADLFSRVDGAVLLAPLDANLPIINPDTLKAARVSGFEVLLATLTATARERIAQGVARNAADPSRALREEVDAKLEIMASAETRPAAQAMLLHAVPNEGARPDWPAIEAITETYARVETPILILWGRRDESLPVAMGYKLASQLPSAELRIFPDAKHSPHLDYPDVVAALIRDFISGADSASPQAGAGTAGPPMPTLETRLIEPALIEMSAPPVAPSRGSGASGGVDPPTP